MFQIIILLLWLTTAESVAQFEAQLPLAKPGCPETCGNIDIPYPFGIGSNCYMADGFAVTCNNSFFPPKPFIDCINLEVVQISVNWRTVQVITYNFPGRADGKDVYLGGTPFNFSDTYERNIESLDWALNGTCNNESLCGANAHCVNNATTLWSPECFCVEGYEGNPYLPSGCILGILFAGILLGATSVLAAMGIISLLNLHA
ncbi:hypothetical protein C3L33_23358, partial [Rhododendron williamsianum]